MLTNLDLEKMKSIFVTKEDLNKMEVRMDKKYIAKKDLERFATKADLKEFATKKDLENFATKQDIQSIKEEMAVFKDIVVGAIQDLRIDMAITRGYGDRLEEHDQRLRKVEEKCEIY